MMIDKLSNSLLSQKDLDIDALREIIVAELKESFCEKTKPDEIQN